MSSLFSKPSSFPCVYSQLMTLLILNEEIEAIRWEQTMSRNPIPNLPAFVPLFSALPFAKMDELSRFSFFALSRMLLLEVLAPSFSCIYKLSLSLSLIVSIPLECKSSLESSILKRQKQQLPLALHRFLAGTHLSTLLKSCLWFLSPLAHDAFLFRLPREASMPPAILRPFSPQFA